MTGKLEVNIAAPQSDNAYTACFVELVFDTGGITHTLCTPTRICGKPAL
jgi:hypothetical protein